MVFITCCVLFVVAGILMALATALAKSNVDPAAKVKGVTILSISGYALIASAVVYGVLAFSLGVILGILIYLAMGGVLAMAACFLAGGLCACIADRVPSDVRCLFNGLADGLIQGAILVAVGCGVFGGLVALFSGASFWAILLAALCAFGVKYLPVDFDVINASSEFEIPTTTGGLVKVY